MTQRKKEKKERVGSPRSDPCTADINDMNVSRIHVMWDMRHPFDHSVVHKDVSTMNHVVPLVKTTKDVSYRRGSLFNASPNLALPDSRVLQIDGARARYPAVTDSPIMEITGRSSWLFQSFASGDDFCGVSGECLTV